MRELQVGDRVVIRRPANSPTDWGSVIIIWTTSMDCLDGRVATITSTRIQRSTTIFCIDITQNYVFIAEWLEYLPPPVSVEGVEGIWDVL